MTQIYGKFLAWTKSVTARHILVVLSTLLLLSAVSIMMLGFVVPKDVVLVEGDNIVTVTTTRIYVEELLAERGITLRSGDRISAPLHSVLRNNDRIIIERGDTIYLTDGGARREIYSCADTLREAFSENGITLGELDEVSPNLDTPVTRGMEVTVCRVRTYQETVDEVVARHIVIKPNTEQYSGYSQVLVEGSDGSATVTYSVTTRDGVETGREELARVVHQEATNQVIEKGILGSRTVVNSKSDLKVQKELICTATAYSASVECNGIYAGKTASGRKPAYGVIAVDPKVIPLGTLMYIEAVDGSWTYGYAIAGDTGGAIKGNKIDLFYDTDYECRQFGRRQARVYILE